ncbi:MAG TPA: DNA translocase FtsK 4TM domain-containing protein, partial [Acidimicrobiales bacterium]|nr:DNA translocase FtsK 4TM domain-containing protein [Acidimicrobiales bacterium]
MATTTRARKRPPSRRPPPRHRSLHLPVGRPPAEVWGALLVLAGLLDGLGTYANLTGPVGRALRAGGGLAVGSGRVLLPLVLVAVGVALVVVGQPDQHPGRRAAGGAVIAVAGAGLLHLAHGSPPLGGPRRAIEHAGGYVGAVVGAPLHRVLATGGATVVLVALAAVGALLAADRGPRAGAAGLGRGAAVAGRGLLAVARAGGAWATSFFEHPGGGDAEERRAVAVVDGAMAGWFDELPVLVDDDDEDGGTEDETDGADDAAAMQPPPGRAAHAPTIDLTKPT